MAKKIIIENVELGNSGVVSKDKINKNFEQVDKALDDLDGEALKKNNVTPRLGFSTNDVPSEFAVYQQIQRMQKEIDSKANNSDVVIGFLSLPFDVPTTAQLTKPTIKNPDTGETITLKVGHAVRVINKVDEEGKPYYYQYDGSNWNETKFTTLPSEVATKLDISTRFFQRIDFLPQESKAIVAIQNITIFGTTDTFKLVSIVNSVDSPHKVGIYNSRKEELVWLYFNNKNEIQKDLGDGAFIYMFVDWTILGDNYLNVSVDGARLVFSDLCYNARVETPYTESTITATKTFSKSPLVPNAVTYNAPITLAQFSSLIVEPIDFTIAELKCISSIKVIEIIGTDDIYKIGVLLNNSTDKTTLWIYNTTKNTVAKLLFKGSNSLTSNLLDGGSISIYIDWAELGNNGINTTVDKARLQLSKRCYRAINFNFSKLIGKILATLGDSIIQQMSNFAEDEGLDIRGWDRLQILTGAKEIINCAIGGSTWQDRTIITDNPKESTATTTGCISNQLLKLKRLVNSGRPTPDIITISAGTNSSGGRGDFATIMAMSYEQLEADLVSRRTFYGGMRYSLEFALREFPNAQIILFAPIQSTDHPNRTFELLLSNAKAIEQMANRYSIPFVNSLFEMGINDLVNSEMYLSDKVHLTSKGKDRMSEFNANKCEQIFSTRL